MEVDWHIPQGWLSKAEILALVLTFALLVSVVQLPAHPLLSGMNNFSTYLGSILGAHNTQYLIDDFFVQANRGYGPRFYYSKLLGLFITEAAIYQPFVCLHFVLKFAWCLAIAALTRVLFGSDSCAMAFSVLCVLAVEGPIIGDLGDGALSNQLEPMNVAMPFAVLGLVSALKQRVLMSVLLFSFASLLHPNVGTVYGTLVLVGVFISSFLSDEENAAIGHRWKWFASGIFFFSLTIAVWVMPIASEPSSQSMEVVSILAKFRAPHHLLLSQTSLARQLDLYCFILSTVILWYLWARRKGVWKRSSIIVGTFVFSVPCIIGGGALLLEVWGHKLGVMLFSARYIELYRLLGLVLFSGVGARLIRSSRFPLLPIAVVVLAACSFPGMLLFSAFLLLGGRVSGLSRSKVTKQMANWILTVSLVLCAVFEASFTRVVLPPAFVVVLFYLLPSRRLVPNLGLAAFICFILFGVFTDDRSYPGRLGEWFERRSIASHLSVDPLAACPVGKLAEFARDKTPEKAIFLTPPTWGNFRILANRAILVDFKSFPFQAKSIVEWFRRMNDAYGPLRPGGFAMKRRVGRRYREISDTRLELLAEKYNLSYAVLHSSTPTRHPALFRRCGFQIVRIS